VFGRIVQESGATSLLQGTILTDVDETVAGIKRQHNVFEQLGIDPQQTFGYRILNPDPAAQGRRAQSRQGPGPSRGNVQADSIPRSALSARVIGEATPERVETVRLATSILEKALSKTRAFQYMAILHNDRVTGMRENKRDFGLQIEIRCWDSLDARKAKPTRIPYPVLENSQRTSPPRYPAW